MAAEPDVSRQYRVSAPDGTWPRDQWPIDVQRTDASGEVDLEQIEYNLSLSPAQRIDQAEQWLEMIEIAREAGRRHYGLERGDAPSVE
jgi:hypothetical protein